MESDSGFAFPGNAVLFVHPSSCWYSPHICEDMGWKVESDVQNGICVGFQGPLACVQALVALQPQTVEKVVKLTPGTGIMGWATSAVSCNWASHWVILTIVLWSRYSRYSRCDFRMWATLKCDLESLGCQGSLAGVMRWQSLIMSFGFSNFYTTLTLWCHFMLSFLLCKIEYFIQLWQGAL